MTNTVTTPQLTVDWAGGNDYSIGRVEGRAAFYIDRMGPRWNVSATDGQVLPIGSGATMREAQEVAERWLVGQPSERDMIAFRDKMRHENFLAAMSDIKSGS